MLRMHSVVLVLSSLFLGMTATQSAGQGSQVPPGRPFQALQSQVSANSAAISGIQGRLSALEGEVATMRNTISQLSAQISANTNDIRSLLNTTQGLSGQLMELRAQHQADLQAINGTLADLTGRMVAAEGNLATMRTELESQLAQLQQVTGDVSGLTMQVAMLTAKVVLLEGSVAQQQQDLATLEVARGQLVGQVNGLTTRIDALEGRVSTLEALHRPVQPCDTGVDPRTNSPWIVCTANTDEAWVSANNGGTYHPEAICGNLGYTRLLSFGGTCGNVCGYCQGPTSCTAPGNRTMDGSGNSGTDDLGRILSFTVHWVCGR